MSDLVERLRDYAENGCRSWQGISAVFTEAADEITRLRSLVGEGEQEPFTYAYRYLDYAGRPVIRFRLRGGEKPIETIPLYTHPARKQLDRKAAEEALDIARSLIQEAKGSEGRQGGFVTNHLDDAENWLDKAETIFLATPAVADSGGDHPLPNIGGDPMKSEGTRDKLAAEERLKQAYAVQQKGVPDQTALVWRVDLGDQRRELLRLRRLNKGAAG